MLILYCNRCSDVTEVEMLPKCTILQVGGSKPLVSVLILPLIETKWRSHSLICQDLFMQAIAMSCVETVNGQERKTSAQSLLCRLDYIPGDSKILAARHNSSYVPEGMLK